MSRSAGFTLIEVMLSTAIIVMLVGLTAPVFETFVRRNDLDLTTQSIASLMRRARTYARSVSTDNAWGIEMQTSSAILFRGTSFASRDTTYDETVAIPATITPSGLTEVQFAKLTAAPNTTGTITLTSTANSTRTITINAKGTVDF